MNKTFVFNSISKPWLIMDVRGRKKPLFASHSRNFIKVPGVPGALLQDTEIEPIVIRQPISFKASDDLSDLLLKDELVKWLITKEPAPLQFDDEPGRTYYAIVQNSIDDFEKISIMRKGTIEFLCLDPYSYGSEVSRGFVDGVAVVENRGTQEASPVIEIDVTGDVTHIDVMTENGFLRMGEAASLEEVIFEPLTKVSELPLTNTVGWSIVSSLDHGYVGGTMGATAPIGFRPTLYGPANIPHDWQGPALRYTLPDPIQDFRFDLDVELLNEAIRSGMIELFGLDTLNRVVFVLGVEDTSQTQALVQGKFLVGGKTNRLHEFIAKPDATSPRAWNNYKGVLRIHRRGNRITPYWSLVDPKGNHVWKYSRHSYVDSLNRNTAPVSQLIIAMRKWPTTPEALMAARNLRAFRYNSEPKGVPIIAKAGDKFVIDMEKSLVTLNGEDFEEVAFGSEFFDIPTGTTAIAAEPSDKLTGKVIFRERNL